MQVIARALLQAVTAGGLIMLLAGAAHASCQGTTHQFCSSTFQATIRCSKGHDLASIVGNHCAKPTGCHLCPGGTDCPLIDPWEPVPIKIVGVEIAVQYGDIAWAFAGNNHTPDVMAMLGAGQTHRQQWFPDGRGFAMPPAGTRGEHHIDLHVGCKRESWGPWQRSVQLFYTVYYVAVAEPE